jgi:hypothetical protein
LFSENLSHIYLQLHDLLEEWNEKTQYVVIHIVVPRLHPDSVEGSGVVEVLGKIVDDDGAR